MKRNILVIALAALLLLASCATSAPSGERDRYKGLILNVDTSTTYVDFSAALAEVAEGQTLQLHCDAYLDTPQQFAFGFNVDLNGYTLSVAPFSKSNTAGLNFVGAIGSHIAKVEIKNGTVAGAAYGNNSSALLRFVYVDNAIVTNVTVISNANDTAATKSNSLYNAYSLLTVNNTVENKVVGRVITYMNDSNLGKDGAFSSKTIINGGTFSNDTTSGDADAFTLSNENGDCYVIINDCYMESGIIDNMSGEALKNVKDMVINGGTFNSIVKTWVAEGHAGSTVDGKYVVK